MSVSVVAPIVPAGHVAGIWKHLPPDVVQSGAGVLPHLPLGCTCSPALQMQKP
jgi:hypothetical protein